MVFQLFVSFFFNQNGSKSGLTLPSLPLLWAQWSESDLEGSARWSAPPRQLRAKRAHSMGQEAHYQEARVESRTGGQKQKTIQNAKARTPLVVQWLRLRSLNSGGIGSNPGQGTRSHMPQTKTCHSQINIFKIQKQKSKGEAQSETDSVPKYSI